MNHTRDCFLGDQPYKR